MNEGIHLDLDTWIVPGQIRKANLCRGLGNSYKPAGTEVLISAIAHNTPPPFQAAQNATTVAECTDIGVYKTELEGHTYANKNNSIHSSFRQYLVFWCPGLGCVHCVHTLQYNYKKHHIVGRKQRHLRSVTRINWRYVQPEVQGLGSIFHTPSPQNPHPHVVIPHVMIHVYCATKGYRVKGL